MSEIPLNSELVVHEEFLTLVLSNEEYTIIPESPPVLVDTNLTYQETAFSLILQNEEMVIELTTEQGIPGPQGPEGPPWTGVTISTENPSGGEDGDIWFKINPPI